jgi:hypothetical protein
MGTGFQARSPIIHLSVIGDLIYCSTLKDSLTLIQFDMANNIWRSVLSDPKPRLSTFHFVANEHVIVVDKEGDVAGLTRERGPPFSGPARHKSFKEHFQAHLHVPIIRIRQGVLRRPRMGDVGANKKESLIAIGIDGTVALIHESPFYDLLKWIQKFWSSGGPLLPGTTLTRYQD